MQNSISYIPVTNGTAITGFFKHPEHTLRASASQEQIVEKTVASAKYLEQRMHIEDIFTVSCQKEEC